MSINNTLEEAWLTVIAMDNFLTRKVLFEKSTFFVEISEFDENSSPIKFKVREGNIDEIVSFNSELKNYCMRYGFYTIINGSLEGNQFILKGPVVKEIKYNG